MARVFSLLLIALFLVVGASSIYMKYSLHVDERERKASNQQEISKLEKDLDIVQKIVAQADPKQENAEANKRLLLAKHHLFCAKLKNDFDGWGVVSELIEMRFDLKKALKAVGHGTEVLSSSKP